MKSILIAILGILIAGCSSSPRPLEYLDGYTFAQYQKDAFDKWVGATLEEVAIVWGIPTRQQVFGETEILEYVIDRGGTTTTQFSSGTYHGYGYYSNNSSTSGTAVTDTTGLRAGICVIQFLLGANKRVKSAGHSGELCRLTASHGSTLRCWDCWKANPNNLPSRRPRFVKEKPADGWAAVCTWIQNEGEADNDPSVCYRDGRWHGQWEARYANGTVHTGPYVDGKRHGYWELQYANGTISTGPYVDGKKRGQWELRFANGNAGTGPFVNGKQHGSWEWRSANGDVETGPYVDGKAHGQWEFRFANGDVWTGHFVDGKKHGHWEERYATGQVSTGPFVDGRRHGQWKLRSANGDEGLVTFVDDKLQQ